MADRRDTTIRHFENRRGEGPGDEVGKKTFRYHLEGVRCVSKDFALGRPTARRPLACVADETKPRYSPSANQRPKACSAPCVLPGFPIIGSNWLLHIA